jgi:hypothetical protein
MLVLEDLVVVLDLLMAIQQTLAEQEAVPPDIQVA